MFVDELRSARARGFGASVATWVLAMTDIARRAPYEHWRRPHIQVRRESRMHSFLSDLRFAVRSFARQKGATALVLLTLTLAVAANTGVFVLLNGLFFRPFPFANPERLVYLNERAPKWNLEFTGINYPDFVAWRKGATAFEAMGLWTEESVNLSDGNDAQRVRGVSVTHDFPTALGIRPVLGRTFTIDEDRPNGSPVVVIGHALWQSRFAGSKDVLGRSLRINSRPHTIIGVLPPAGEFPEGAQFWLPLAQDPNQPWQSYSFDGVARLKPGVTIEQGRLDLIEAHRPVWLSNDTAQVVSPRIMSLRDKFVGDFRPMGKALGAGVALVLLIACANVAGTMLARATLRQRELAMRLALGASAARVARQMLTEALALSAIAGVLGTALGIWGIRALVFSATDRFPRWVRLELDARAVLFSVAIVAITAVLFGLVPALQARRPEMRESLSAGGPRGSTSKGHRRVLDVLVVVENALAVVLLATGMLLLKAYANVRDVDPGFTADGVAMFRVALPTAKYRDGQDQRAFYERIIGQLTAIPGVTAVGAITCPPFTCHRGQFYEAEGGRPPAGTDEPDPVVLTLGASAGFFPALGIRAVRGRIYGETEGGPAQARPAVVNESFVRRMWPDGTDAVGRRFRFRGDTSSRGWFTVTGVTRDVKHYGLDQPSRPSVYLSMALMDSTNSYGSMAFTVKTPKDPAALFAPMRAVVQSIDPELPLFEVRTMREELGRSLALRRMLAFALAAFAAIALTLAVGGIYAMLSYVVGRRRREIGIRMALGAGRGQVVGMVVRQGGQLVAIGLALGIPLALGVTRLVSSQLVGVSAHDLLTYLAVAGILAVTGVAAALVPARRAAMVDPTVTLSEAG